MYNIISSFFILFNMKEITSQYSIKYRPRTWEEIYGQPLIVKALRERVLQNNFPKAILLEGPYGVGKTSFAQIFAACIQASLPDGNPDWSSPSNKAILNETFDRDTQRLDGSQIGGKMDIVEFTSSIKIKPMYDKKRIFIIEEADQLSSAAMNALLKVLEDPSPNVHFILLSMMDKKGVPNAIKSRCQVFRLKSIGIADLMKAMKNVMEKAGSWNDESIPETFKLEGLKTIAELSNGSLRVAIQNLESCLISKTFNIEEIRENLGGDERLKTYKLLYGLLDKTNDEEVWYQIFNTDAMQLYNYMTVLLSEAILYKETKFAYDEKEEGLLRRMSLHPNVETLYYNLILHPQMNKPFMRTADLIGALVGYYQGLNFMTDVKKIEPTHLKEEEKKITIGVKGTVNSIFPLKEEISQKIAVRKIPTQQQVEDEIPW